MDKSVLRNELCEIYDVINKGRFLHSELTGAAGRDLQWVIPSYQRGYSWEAENFNDFIDTMEELSDRGSVELKYFGQLILHIGQDDSLEIVDGQQRLTTYLILAKVLLEHYETLPEDDYNREDFDKLYEYLYLSNGLPRFKHQSKNRRVIEEYIYLREPESAAEQQIKSLYEEYKNYLNEGPEYIEQYREKLYSEYKRQYCKLKKADYNSIILGHKELSKFCKEKSEKGKKFANFEQNLISNSSITTSLLMSRSFETAYESFMSLNGKGRSLTTFDLIKSEFIGNLTKPGVTLEFNIENDWDSYIDIKDLNSKKIVEIFDIMLKIEYREFYFKFKAETKVSKRTYLRDMLHELNKTEDLLEIYEKFKDYIENYQSMLDGRFNQIMGSASYKEFDNDVSLALEMGYVPFLPLLFEFIGNYELHSKEQLSEILNIIRYVPFVYVTVCGLRPSHLTDSMTKYLDPSNDYEYCEKIYNLKKKFINASIKETFVLNLPETTITTEAVSKDILLLLEGIDGATKHLKHLEHIYPQKAKAKEWPGITKESLNKIGNHAIISKSMNESLKNFSLDKKMEIITSKFSDEVIQHKYFNDLYEEYKEDTLVYDAEKVIERGETYTKDLVKKFEEIGLF